ncbi:MAG TPA: acyl-CoA dehydrogenase family protein [Bryobacteraceae bacterium]|nr:acyl-CoA dehydrogenase family protein [Bryobacteraceae bacterium]
MSATTETYESTLERVCTESISPHAAAVDKDGTFPTESISALAKSGLLGALSSAESGGLDLGLPGAARIVRRVAEECGSTAMVLTMHYCGAAVLEAHGPKEVKAAAAAGTHLSTLAFSESGSRSHFWAPASTASELDGRIQLNARKSWVTSAAHATAYVWSSRPLAADGASTIWLIPASSSGLTVAGPFEGLGLRGNDSCPVTASNLQVPPSAMLGADGQGFEIMMSIVLPVFSVLNAACSNGLMAGAIRRTVEHATQTRHSDTGAALADLPTIRNYIARMRLKADLSDALLGDTLAAIAAKRDDSMVRVLECKAAAAETANEVLDLAMRICGGAAFRKEVGVERIFRDARAAGVMAPTTDVLYDFLGKAVCGMPLF